MRYPHIVAFVLYEFVDRKDTVISKGFHVPALVTPLSNPDGTVKLIGGGTFLNVLNEGSWNIFISKAAYFGLQLEFNVRNSRSKVDIHNARDEYNPFDVNFAAGELPTVPSNFIESVALYDGYAVLKKTVSIVDF